MSARTDRRGAVAAAESEAIRADAEQRIAQLRRVAARLYSDRDDPQVLAELLSVLGQLRAAETALRSAAATAR